MEGLTVFELIDLLSQYDDDEIVLINGKPIVEDDVSVEPLADNEWETGHEDGDSDEDELLDDEEDLEDDEHLEDEDDEEEWDT